MPVQHSNSMPTKESDTRLILTLGPIINLSSLVITSALQTFILMGCHSKQHAPTLHIYFFVGIFRRRWGARIPENGKTEWQICKNPAKQNDRPFRTILAPQVAHADADMITATAKPNLQSCNPTFPKKHFFILPGRTLNHTTTNCVVHCIFSIGWISCAKFFDETSSCHLFEIYSIREWQWHTRFRCLWRYICKWSGAERLHHQP